MNSKFKVGDILKFEDGMRAIVASCYPQATNSNECLYYLWSWYKGAIDWDSWSESELVNKVKIIDQIDISSVVDDGFHITCTKEDIEQAQEVEKAWDKAADICRMRDEINSLKKENEELKKQKDDKAEILTKIQNAWKDGWYECLKTFKYYLGTDEDEE